MSNAHAITGYDFVRNIFDAYPGDPISKLLEITGGETEYLELKATCIFSKNSLGNQPWETQDDLSWNIARELFALHNSKGGVLIIGITDKTFEPVPLPDFGSVPPNDYMVRMIRNKIFPPNFRWVTKRGSEIHQCDAQIGTAFINNALHMEVSQYQGWAVVALFVEPAPCLEGRCIQIQFKKNQDQAYDQMPVRQSGNTGEIRTITQWKDKKAHESTRHIVDREFGRLWEKHQPLSAICKSRSRSTPAIATATDGLDPESDPLTRALEGRPLETEFAPGTTIGHYRIIRKIGQGGMGVVYEVEHAALKERRAIKIFAPEDPEDLLKRKFLSEARLLAKFRHPGLVKVHTLGLAPNSATLYYEMDLIVSPNGKPTSLRDIFKNLDKERPSDHKLREWFAELCNVLSYLHNERSIVHRDIKLDNILINSTGKAILTDFGIARIRDKELKKLIGDGMTMNPTMAGVGDANIGTSEYLAPELQTEKASAQSDIYALGVVFYKLLTGKTFSGESGEELKFLLRGKPRFWKRVLPKLLARNKAFRLKNVSRYAVKAKYPSSNCISFPGYVAVFLFGMISTIILMFLMAIMSL